MRYGLPYKGSKNLIAEDIINFLPQGNRLVDLFGGGGAITHCASFSNKWQSILYNELNPLVYKGFKMALNKEFQNETRWIDRDTFEELKTTDPYVAFCFSFANDLKTYVYGKEIYAWKKALYYARVFKDYSLLQELDIYSDGSRQDVMSHYEEYCIKYGRSIGVKLHCNEIQSLEALNTIKRFSVKDISKIELLNNTYLNYVYKDGDVVYCDIPYENTDCGIYHSFNNIEFYNWCLTRPYQVFFSSYRLKTVPKGLYEVWSKEKRVRTSSSTNQKFNIEVIYCNQPYNKQNTYIFGV